MNKVSDTICGVYVPMDDRDWCIYCGNTRLSHYEKWYYKVVEVNEEE